MKKDLLVYGVGSLLLVITDQVTKAIALAYWQHEQVVTPFLSFCVTLNRGISWGLIASAETSTFMFLAVSLCIILLTFGLAIYARNHYLEGHSIIGEALIIAGSISNIIDRYIHKGVVDFIVVHWESYVWPVFNLADMAIVCGVAIMAVSSLTRNE
jgi:signal peptidase II